jgi:hypothetical protein
MNRNSTWINIAIGVWSDLIFWFVDLVEDSRTMPRANIRADNLQDMQVSRKVVV